MSTNEAAVDVPASDSMPNTPAQAEPARENHGAEEKQEMTIEDYKSALEKVRREAAKYRTGNKELRPLAQRAKEAEEAGKSELQKAHMAQLGLEVAPARIQGYGPHATYDALARTVMSRDFLDTESRMFLDGMSSGFLDVCGGGIAGWLFHCISVERSQISIPFVTARRSHSFAKNWESRGRRTTTSKAG